MAAWAMTEDGEFILNEPYATMLHECKLEAAIAFQGAAFRYIAERTNYTEEQLADEFKRYAMKEDMPHIERMDQFVVRALEGDL